MEIPELKSLSDKDEFVQELTSDSTLTVVRSLADRQMRGYKWENQRIIHSKYNHLFDLMTRLVVPRKYRERVIAIAHKSLGHLGVKKTTKELNRLFTWPGISKQVKDFIAHCEPCLKHN